jgi:hypothetical protein
MAVLNDIMKTKILKRHTCFPPSNWPELDILQFIHMENRHYAIASAEIMANGKNVMAYY